VDDPGKHDERKWLTHFLGNCRDCGYPLVRLLSDRCPECGRPFDPTDPRTMDFGRSRIIEFLKKPTTFWTWLPAILLIGCAATGQIVFPRTPAADGLVAVAALVTLSTMYIASARRRFRSFLRKQEREKH
jgi:hypothetical protein